MAYEQLVQENKKLKENNKLRRNVLNDLKKEMGVLNERYHSLFNEKTVLDHKHTKLQKEIKEKLPIYRDVERKREEAKIKHAEYLQFIPIYNTAAKDYTQIKEDLKNIDSEIKTCEHKQTKNHESYNKLNQQEKNCEKEKDSITEEIKDTIKEIKSHKEYLDACEKEIQKQVNKPAPPAPVRVQQKTVQQQNPFLPQKKQPVPPSSSKLTDEIDFFDALPSPSLPSPPKAREELGNFLVRKPNIKVEPKPFAPRPKPAPL